MKSGSNNRFKNRDVYHDENDDETIRFIQNEDRIDVHGTPISRNDEEEDDDDDDLFRYWNPLIPNNRVDLVSLKRDGPNKHMDDSEKYDLHPLVASRSIVSNESSRNYIDNYINKVSTFDNIQSEGRVFSRIWNRREQSPERNHRKRMPDKPSATTTTPTACVTTSVDYQKDDDFAYSLTSNDTPTTQQKDTSGTMYGTLVSGLSALVAAHKYIKPLIDQQKDDDEQKAAYIIQNNNHNTNNNPTTMNQTTTTNPSSMPQTNLSSM
jgi:hypothetical protein